jgi:hypothetical protein
MYGVGYDFAPQFAYCLKDIVGSLPVGMDCMSGDMPHWCATNTATSKEIWVEPVNRFLGAVSIYAAYEQISGSQGKNGKQILMKAETTRSDNGDVTINVTFTGSGKHEIDIKTFNSSANPDKRRISLSANKPDNIKVELKVTDINKPYIAVISVDNDPELQKEIVGSLNKATL